MNYKPNEIDWKVGDLVIHDADSKKEHMLMEVVKINRDGTYVTKYKTPELISRLNRNRYINDKKGLLNPKDFGIETSEKPSEAKERRKNE